MITALRFIIYFFFPWTIQQIFACTKESSNNSVIPAFVPDTVIMSKVVDSLGIGIANIIIKDSTGNTQFTNINGQFSL